MIDYEIDIFDEMARLVWQSWPTAYVANQYVRAPPSFPAVLVVEASNTAMTSREDSSGEENAAALTYAIEVYATKETGGKAACKAILSEIDSRMRLRNMTRTMQGPVGNPDDQSIYRIVARYTGVIDKNGTHFRR